MNYKVCRTCGENEGSTYIFDKNQNLPVSAKISYCCPKVNITEEDHLSAFICCKCEEELNVTYQFILRCETTDRRLRLTLITSNQDVEDYKPKVEVKVEDTYSSENESHYDILTSFSTNEKDKLEIKDENYEPNKLCKQPKRRCNAPKTAVKKCAICGHQCVSTSALAMHMRKHNGHRPFKCSNCSKDYKEKGNLIRHMKTSHNPELRSRDFICEHCGKGFYSKSDVKIHMRTHTGETPYVCTECPAKFTQIGALSRHKKRHTGEKLHACTICGKHFCTKDELNRHSKKHSNEKKYFCPICKHPFKYMNNMKKHLLLHSTPDGFVCNYCGRTFNQKGNLKMHINRKHSEKSGHCNICLKNVSDIEVHMWRHTGQRPLKCEYCASSFSDMKTLARHVNYRHKNHDFKCSYEGCGMKFPAKIMLTFHNAKLHETGIPFPCDKCTRGFYRKNDLARHKIGTHKERLI